MYGEPSASRARPFFPPGVTIFGMLAMRGDHEITRLEGVLLLAQLAFVTIAVVRGVS